MINLTCPCGFRFSLPDELAGGAVQCPKCRRLNEIPEFDELPNLEPDGTIKLKPAEETPRKSAFVQQVRFFDPDRRGADGEEYDLRPTLEDVKKAGVEEIPLDLKDEPRPGPPKYDPETGELIRPIDVAPAPPAPPSAVRAPRAPAEEPPPDNRFLPVPARLASGASLVVLVAIYAIHVVAVILLSISSSGVLIAAPALLAAILVLVAHYGAVVDEIAIEQRDELPAPLRQMGFAEDIRHPISSVLGAVLLCYAPALAARDWPAAAAALLIAGTIVFPAVFLTLVTSGSVLNLRPDRIAGVIRRCGVDYAVSVILWCLAVAVYGAAWMGVWRFSAALAGSREVRRLIDISPGAGFAVLFGAIYLMHLFCWHLGLLYRRHHDAFPWVLQRHPWAARNEPPVRRRRRRPAASADLRPANRSEQPGAPPQQRSA